MSADTGPGAEPGTEAGAEPGTESGVEPATEPGAESGAGKVIVVGGGIIGIACAHYLAAAGYRVEVIDQGPIGGACSRGNLGMICPSHLLPLTEPGALAEGVKSLFNPSAPLRVKLQLRTSLYLWMLQFARRCNHRQMLRASGQLQPLLESSAAQYRALFSAGLGGQWKDNGLLYVLATGEGMDRFAGTDELLSRHFGLTAQRLAGDALVEFDPALKTGLAGGYFYPDDGSVRPEQLISDWKARLLEAGVSLVEDCRLLRVVRSARGIEALETSRGRRSADRYVFAAGAWSQRLARELGCRIPVEPGKGYSLTASRPRRCPRHPMLFPEHRVGATPFDDGYRVGSMMEFAGYDSRIPPGRIQQLRDSVRPYLHEPEGAPPEETWYGWRPMTWDSLPIVGRVPGLDGALLATGHNMLGVTLAPATGKLIAELVQEHPPHIEPGAFSPARFQ